MCVSVVFANCDHCTLPYVVQSLQRKVTVISGSAKPGGSPSSSPSVT